MEWGRGAGSRNSQGGAQPCPPLGEDDAPPNPAAEGLPGRLQRGHIGVTWKHFLSW